MAAAVQRSARRIQTITIPGVLLATVVVEPWPDEPQIVSGPETAISEIRARSRLKRRLPRVVNKGHFPAARK